MTGLHRNPSGQSTFAFDRKIKRKQTTSTAIPYATIDLDDDDDVEESPQKKVSDHKSNMFHIRK